MSDELICQEFVELVTDYLDGALPRRERRRVEAHLRDCGGCSAYLEQFRVTVASLAELPPEPPDDGTRAALLAMFRDVRRS
jgi:anti-sigma factor RsiW